MRSFRVYRREPVVVPAREDADYSAEERNRLRDRFSPIALRYRRRIRIEYCAVGGFIAGLALAIILPTSVSGLFIVLIVLCWLVMFGAILTAPRLVCPGCSNEMEGFGRYCPECGKPELQTGGWLSCPRCAVCCKRLRRNKVRNYRIRACTHCGLILDEKGL